MAESLHRESNTVPLNSGIKGSLIIMIQGMFLNSRVLDLWEPTETGLLFTVGHAKPGPAKLRLKQDGTEGCRN